jgi:hypothetical protein
MAMVNITMSLRTPAMLEDLEEVIENIKVLSAGDQKNISIRCIDKEIRLKYPADKKEPEQDAGPNN